MEISFAMASCQPKSRDSTISPDHVSKPGPPRSRQACDLCRLRRTKCVSSVSTQQACNNCLARHVPCTLTKPTKRRGPPGKHAQALRERARNTSEQQSSTPLPLESLATLATLRSILLEWFDLYHPACPIMHRASILARLDAGDTLIDSSFSCLIVAVVCSTVGNLRRAASDRYPEVTLERCEELLETMGFFDSRHSAMTLERCQTSYHMSCAYMWFTGTLDSVQGFKFLHEAVMIMKWIVAYKLTSMEDLAEVQLLKRTFWILFAGASTSDIHKRPYLELLHPSSNHEVLKPLPLTDVELRAPQNGDEVQWIGDWISYVPGLNRLAELFLLWHESQQRSLDTMQHLQAHMSLVRSALDYLPPELSWRGNLSMPQNSSFGTSVQTANLYITQLHIRHNLLEQMIEVSQRPGNITVSTPEVYDERKLIVNDMLELLRGIPHAVLRANGYSLIQKIRDIGTALLEQPNFEKSISPEAPTDLHTLLGLLQELEGQV